MIMWVLKNASVSNYCVLPKDALPYVPSALAPQHVEYRLRENPEVVNIGIASTTMKLNPISWQH